MSSAKRARPAFCKHLSEFVDSIRSLVSYI